MPIPVSSLKKIQIIRNANAIKINAKIITDEKLIIDKHYTNKNHLKLSIGKKRHLKIELN